jgi:uncharacterized membrane protein YeaQ/YmgE (transglycosylase-associated protein family)
VYIIVWIIFGLIVGVVAKFLMPGRDPGGFILTTALGIVGALVGGWLGRAMGSIGTGSRRASSWRSSERWWCCSCTE